jgi:hypothetical protein
MELILLKRRATIDTEALAKGLSEMHEENPDLKAIWAFGMLDHDLCEMFEKSLFESINNSFSSVIQMAFDNEIKKFSKDCFAEISKRAYSYAKNMVV